MDQQQIQELKQKLEEKSSQVKDLLSHINVQNQDKVLDNYQSDKHENEIARLKKIIETMQLNKVKKM